MFVFSFVCSSMGPWVQQSHKQTIKKKILVGIWKCGMWSKSKFTTYKVNIFNLLIKLVHQFHSVCVWKVIEMLKKNGKAMPHLCQYTSEESLLSHG